MTTAGAADFNIIFLIGYRATGKTSVARILGERLGWSWIDTDLLLEEQTGRTIRQIFIEEGEAGFRQREAQVLAGICRVPKQVVATGGGIILSADNRKLLRDSGRVVWLNADEVTIWNRLQQDAAGRERRPTLTVGGLEEVQTLLRERQPHYDACADLCVETAGHSVEEVADIIVAAIADGTLRR
jgi:shikimate kinase